MLKFGVKYEEVVTIAFENKIVKIRVEKRSGNQAGLCFDADKDIFIFRESAKNKAPKKLTSELKDGE